MTVHFDSLKATAGLDAGPVRFQDALSGSWYSKIGKRVFDLLLVLVSLPVVLPVLLLLAFAIFVTSGRPIYRQRRVGLHGREFTMFKFRTMVPNSDRLLQAYLETCPEAREEWARHQKLRNDPRVTWIGRFLRKTSLDELPQVLNVLTGDMALVGPRPMLPEQRDLYPGTEYYTMRPGITGFWQISERNECSFSERAFHDANYARAITLGTDVHVLARTLAVVLRGTGC